MAQQARPNVTGHMLCFLAQLTALSMVVSRTPFFTSSSTDSLLPVCTPGRRSIGMGHPRAGGDELRGTLPSLSIRSAQSRCSAALATAGRPVEASGLPDVDVGDEDQADEDDHLDEAEEAELAELHGPGEEEDGFDVEDDEEHGDQVELDGEAVALGDSFGDDAAFVGGDLGGGGVVGAQQRRGGEGRRGEDEAEAGEDDDREVGAERRGRRHLAGASRNSASMRRSCMSPVGPSVRFAMTRMAKRISHSRGSPNFVSVRMTGGRPMALAKFRPAEWYRQYPRRT